MENRGKFLSKAIFEKNSSGFERLPALCDGVFAIAMTLLVLDIKMPEGIGLKDINAFNEALGILLTKSLFYLLTFITVAGYWMGNRRLMSYVKRQDGPFTLLTFLFLAFIVFFPVSFNVLVTSPHIKQVVVFYTLVLTGCGLSAFSLWAYASWGHRLIDPDVSRHEIISRSIGVIINPVYFCLSLLFLNVTNDAYFVFFTWVFIPVFVRAVRVISNWSEKYLQQHTLAAKTHQKSELSDASESASPAAIESPPADSVESPPAATNTRVPSEAIESE